jgi:hypothetical protein
VEIPYWAAVPVKEEALPMTISPAAKTTPEWRPVRERITKPANPRIIPFFITFSLLKKKLAPPYNGDFPQSRITL